jgi:hypothetical protein
LQSQALAQQQGKQIVIPSWQPPMEPQVLKSSATQISYNCSNEDKLENYSELSQAYTSVPKSSIT